MKKTKLMLGDNIESLKKLPDNSVDSVVTDPPYGLSFMNKKWDYDVPSTEFWMEVYRVLKPGGHVLSFGGTRTYHRMVVNIEDAGFEIRDQIQWIYGSGFPKSHNISKAIDKVEGNERKVIGRKIQRVDGTTRNLQPNGGFMKENVVTKKSDGYIDIEEPGSENSKQYEGWGTALKPANEPICVARKPLSEKTIAENVLKWGTGGINVDGCRVGYIDDNDKKSAVPGGKVSYTNESWGQQAGLEKDLQDKREAHNEGRFPANIILECICDEVIKGDKGENGKKVQKGDKRYGENNFTNGGMLVRDGWESNVFKDKGDIHTDPNCPCRLLDEQSGESKSNDNVWIAENKNNYFAKKSKYSKRETGYTDKGGASRFFYQAKVSKAERNMGLDGFEEKEIEMIGQLNNSIRENGTIRTTPEPKKNHHPTVKPINLMAYLCRLITPEGGIVLDPFMGSGSTGVAAQLEGFRFVGMEMDKDYFNIAEARIDSYEKYEKFKK